MAMVHYCKGICQLTLTNNELQKLPNLIGLHKNIKNIQVDGNPLKSIRRTIIEKGSSGILRYLMDRYVEENDNKIEDWAKEQDEADKKQMESFAQAQEAAKIQVEEAKMAEIKSRHQEEEKQVEPVPLQIGQV